MSIPNIVSPLISKLTKCEEVKDETESFLRQYGCELQQEGNKIYLVESAREVTSSHDNDLSIYEERDGEIAVKRYYEWNIGSKYPPFSTSSGYVEI